MTRPRCDHTAAWALLSTAFEATGKAFDLRDAFATEPHRFAHFSQSAPHVFADLSKNLLDMATEQQLFALARQCGLESHRDAMFAGAPVNHTEQRAALHCLLRNKPLRLDKQASNATNNRVNRQAQVDAGRSGIPLQRRQQIGHGANDWVRGAANSSRSRCCIVPNGASVDAWISR